MANLLEVLKEQVSFGFTGKVNILLVNNGQFHAVAYLSDGFIVGASTGSLKGKSAIFKMIFDDVETHALFKYIVEPELVAAEHFLVKMTFEELRDEAQKIYQQYTLAKKLKPAMDLRLVVDPEIIVNDVQVTPEEFDILSVLSEWCTVADIYKYSKLMDFEVTNALVSLRKKRAIKVFQN